LANKETLVVAGHLLKAEQERSGALCIPVDSEHNAIYQLLMGKDPASIDSLVLTASGGPFWQQRDLDFDAVSPESAVRHPNWKMGPKISVDSATLMNKGMEVVEAHSLFGMPADRIEVWIHPQSIVHGAVWFEDGTCQAQMSKPDMKASIGFALGFPDRLPRSVDKLSIKQFAQLDFAEPDTTRFPCLDLPRLALAAGQSHLVALNAANEVTVEAFLAKKIRFSQIPQVLRQVLDSHRSREVDALEGVFTTDALARQKTQEILQSLCV
jgi:1-deoxy-D-xylulose-5-phosphate reductoisomerase